MSASKIIFGMVSVIALSLLGLGIYGYIVSDNGGNNLESEKVITLSSITQTFNNADDIKSYEENGMSVTATETENSLIISIGDTNYTYTLENNILTVNLDKEDINGALMLMVLVDSIGQLHGYEAEETYPTLNSEGIKNYTIDQGFQMIETEDNVTAKININKKLELMDFSNVYIEVSDLSDLTEYIKAGGSAQTGKGNVYLYKYNEDNKINITIGEKDNLTENTYKSLLSVIEVIYDLNEATRFASSVPTLSNTTFDQYKVEINPTLNDMESFVFEELDYKFVRVTIDQTQE